MKVNGRMEVKHNAFLTSAVDVGEWSASWSGRSDIGPERVAKVGLSHIGPECVAKVGLSLTLDQNV
jgi:hypothetical protein